MKPFEVVGEAFSSYYLERVFPEAPEFRNAANVDKETLSKARRVVGDAYRTLAMRQTSSSVLSQLIRPLGELFDWGIGEPETVNTALGEDEPAGNAITFADSTALTMRVFCAGPEDAIDATPQGHHRRYALTAVVERVLEATQTPYAVIANRHELRVVRSRAAGPGGSIIFDLSALREYGASIDRVWRLLFALLRASSNEAEPRVLDQILERGRREMVGVGQALGSQVREAIEIFIRGLYANGRNQAQLPGRGDREKLAKLYAESLRVLYRCLFILYAEARSLVPLDLPIYRESYSLSDAAQLPELGIAARLRAVFGLLRRGVDLGNGERVPAFGGSIFSRDEAELVEGLEWEDGPILAMLRKLVVIDSPRGQIPVSYRELDEERLGSIYEGLLALSLSVAASPMREIELQGRVMALSSEQLSSIKISNNGAFTPAESGATVADESEEESASSEDDESGDSTGQLHGRGQRTARLIRDIALGEPYLASSSGRKETASYYTARDLVDFLVRETIDPLAAHAEPSTILALRVVDPAMGSGHFLVGALRRLADHLVAAYHRVEERDGEAALPDGIRGALDDERELVRVCRQLVAVHCLYGVDKNPLAIDLARVALWLATAAAGHPLSFLDHRLKCGDSLLGLDLQSVTELADLRPRKKRGAGQLEVLQAGAEMVTETGLEVGLNRALEQTFRNISSFAAIVSDEDQTFEDKRETAKSVERAMRTLRELHEARIGRMLDDDDAYRPLLTALGDFATYGYLREEASKGLAAWRTRGGSERAFCWEVEFPEVFYRALPDQAVIRREDAGFDVVLGNPPWDKLKLERKQYYYRYDPLIIDSQGNTADKRIAAVNDSLPGAKANFDRALRDMKAYNAALEGTGRYRWQRVVIDGERTGGDPDSFKYFTELAFILSRDGGHVGLVTPGAFTSDSGTTGLRQLVLEHDRLVTLFVFENRRKLFDIDSRFKFQVLHAIHGGKTSDFEGAFWVHDTDLLRLPRHERAQRSLTIRIDDVRRASGNRLAILEVHSERDLRVARQLQNSAPALGAVGDDWPLTFGRELDMSQDRKLFHTAKALAEEGGERHGDVYVMPDQRQFIPLREGRMVQAFDSNAKRYVSGEGRSAVWAENGRPKAPLEPHYWVDVNEIPSEFRRTDCRLYWCDVTGATNERTSMCAIIEGLGVCTESLRAVYVSRDNAHVLDVIAAVMNSFVFDWYMRMLVNQHMSNHFVEPAPCLRTIPLINLPKYVAEVSSSAIGYTERAGLRAELDAAVALGYELTYVDFAHILDGFPLLDRAEPPLEGEKKSTITRDLALAAYCRLGGEHDPEHNDRVIAARQIGAIGYVPKPLRQQIGAVIA